MPSSRKPSFGRIIGFTLIELMVVIAVIGILAAIAFPSYERYVVRSWQAKASGCVNELAQGMERRFTARLSYAGADLPPNGCTAEIVDAGRYTFSFVAEPTPTAYEVRAVPVGRQAERETRCGTISLDQAGTKRSTGSFDPADCV